jgi:hypothetical protein
MLLTASANYALVDSLIFNNDTITTAAAITRSTLDDFTEEMELTLAKPGPASTNGAVTQTYMGDFATQFSLSGGPATTSLSIETENSSISSSLAISGWSPVSQLAEAQAYLPSFKLLWIPILQPTQTSNSKLELELELLRILTVGIRQLQ